MSHNDQTLQTYADKLQAYIDSTPEQINASEYPWIDQALSLIPKSGKILELGSGFGRNAVYIQNKGYHIECTDAIQEFVDILEQKHLNAYALNALKDDFGNGNDMIFANGVLVHFTPEETDHVLSKVHHSLAPGGIFAFSVKQGNGAEWSEEKLNAPRFFYHWQPDVLQKTVAAHGFEWVSMLKGETSLRNASWLYAIARKAGK